MLFLVSDKLKIIVGWTPKCACTTIKKWFFDTLGVEFKNVHQGSFDSQYKLTVDQNSNIKNQLNKYNKYTKVLFIRDPYKRMVSGYINKVVKEDTSYKKNRNFRNFKSFVYNHDKTFALDGYLAHHFNPQTLGQFKYFKSMKWEWDFVIDIESMNDGIKEVNKVLGTNVIPSDRAHPKNTTHYQDDPSKINKAHLKPYYLTPQKLKTLEVKNKLPPYNFFYNKDLIKACESIYSQDFKYFKSLGITYTNPEL